jgi:hypothetical protein
VRRDPRVEDERFRRFVSRELVSRAVKVPTFFVRS